MCDLSKITQLLRGRAGISPLPECMHTGTGSSMVPSHSQATLAGYQVFTL